MMIETIALRYGNAVVYLRKCQQHAATKYVNISLNLFTSPNTTFNNTVGHKSSNDDCHENRDKDSLPSFNLGCNLEERLVIGEYCIPLASFFGLWSKRHMVVNKHCVRFEGIHIGQGQIYCTCNWSKSLNQFSGKLGIKYIELCTLGSITDKHYEIEVNFKVHTVDS